MRPLQKTKTLPCEKLKKTLLLKKKNNKKSTANITYGENTMCKVRITVVKIANHEDLSAKYEIPQDDPCPMSEGMIFTVDDFSLKPHEICESAWQTLTPFMMTLGCGGQRIYGDWMKNPKSAMISCNDGFRPVSFLLEAVE